MTNAPPTTVDQAFEIFDQRIALTAEEREAAFRLAEAICASLSREDGIRKCVIAGSLVKSTAISKVSDVDLVAILDQSRVGDIFPATAVSAVEKVAREIYPQAGISGNIITIPFESGLRVDVLPAILESDDDLNQEYLIPNESRDDWQKYALTTQVHKVLEASAKFGPSFKRLVRLVKMWSKGKGSPISSYEIETTAVECLGEEGMPILARAIKKFFEAALLNHTADDVSRPVLEDALSQVERALYFESVDDMASAAHVWRRLLGEDFPAVIG